MIIKNKKITSIIYQLLVLGINRFMVNTDRVYWARKDNIEKNYIIQLYNQDISLNIKIEKIEKSINECICYLK